MKLEMKYSVGTSGYNGKKLCTVQRLELKGSAITVQRLTAESTELGLNEIGIDVHYRG